MLYRAQLLLNTVRYLKPVQIFGRLWFQFYRPSLKEQKAPPVRSATSGWVAGAKRSPSLTGPERFRFLNKEGRLPDKEGWNDPAKEKLWLYNLHYFDDLNAEDAAARAAWHRALMARWIDENPLGAGNGWEPYPSSLRIVNWIMWALRGNAMEPRWLDSLAMQVRYLRKRLEYHLLGNHLFANAKALVFAGLYFSGKEADEWLAKGLAILSRELPEQILADGGHFERSPMYHNIILEDLLDLVNLAGVYGLIRTSGQKDLPTRSWIDAVQAMRSWQKVMSHPDGQVSFFNDAATGVAPALAELEAYADRLLLEAVIPKVGSITELAASGYLRLEQGAAVALLDVGEIGPDYLPGHAHADTLSFECSLFGQRVIVNSGISCYGSSGERLRQRGTSVHSTVEINGENSSEVWGGFRVARRARPFGLEVRNSPDVLSVSCAHDGYIRLPGQPVHRRSWRLQIGELEVIDRVEGQFNRAIGRYYLHPDISLVPDSMGNGGAMRLKNGQTVAWRCSGGKARVLDSTWHPEFGMSMRNQMIEVVFDEPEVKFALRWEEASR